MSIFANDIEYHQDRIEEIKVATRIMDRFEVQLGRMVEDHEVSLSCWSKDRQMTFFIRDNNKDLSKSIREVLTGEWHKEVTEYAHKLTQPYTRDGVTFDIVLHRDLSDACIIEYKKEKVGEYPVNEDSNYEIHSKDGVDTVVVYQKTMGKVTCPDDFNAVNHFFKEEIND